MKKGDPKGRLAKSRKLVPEARVELARRETTVFETAASAIPPLGHISLHSITEARIRVYDKIAPRLALLSRVLQESPYVIPSLRSPPAPRARSSRLPLPSALSCDPCAPCLPAPRARQAPRTLGVPESRAPRARPAPILLSRIARLRAVRGLRTGVKLVR